MRELKGGLVNLGQKAHTDELRQETLEGLDVPSADVDRCSLRVLDREDTPARSPTEVRPLADLFYSVLPMGQSRRVGPSAS